MQSSAIFPLFYLGPVSYFAALTAYDDHFLIEKQEHFPKQTYRNRAKIYSPNGALDLYVPVVKGSKVHTIIKDVKISYDFRWQRLHWMSLQSCYRNSAYFEYYEDEFSQFYTKKYDYLFDYNLEIFQWILKQLKRNISVNFTSEYLKELPQDMVDYRDRLQFKDSEDLNLLKPYFQVFDDRKGFLPNLSIVDLLFNQGPQAKLFL